MTADPGPLLASGRAADVFDLGDGTVLRRYREAHNDIELEARVMAHVAERNFPVPVVHAVNGNDIVMDRVDGPTMLERLVERPWTVFRHARTLARLQRRLAAIEAPPWLLASTADPSHEHSVLHLDLHPMNVILSPGGPVVIDWTNAAGGPAGFDAAVTYVEAATFTATSTAERALQWLFVRSFRRIRGRRLLDAYLGAACDHRLADRNVLPDERIAIAALRKKVRRAT